jgi:formate hydrogenlyase subunit 6/NADH:ubiquinone oxidoreductase subunit I
MDALQLKVSPEAKNKYRKAAVVNPDLCIGCGVCVQKCPSDALILERHEPATRPPETARDWVMSYAADLETSGDQDR